jgi:beta-galactosidase
MLWVNGHNLGRYWKIGPQQTLYCPGVWLKSGRNEIMVLEYLETENPVVQGLEEPILSKLRTDLDFSQKLTKTSR